MSRTAKKPLKTFVLDVLDADGNAIPGCTYTYNRLDGYAAYFAGQLLGAADSAIEAQTMSIEAANAATRRALAELQALPSPTRPDEIHAAKMNWEFRTPRGDDSDDAAASVAVFPTPSPRGGPGGALAMAFEAAKAQAKATGQPAVVSFIFERTVGV